MELDLSESVPVAVDIVQSVETSLTMKVGGQRMSSDSTSEQEASLRRLAS